MASSLTLGRAVVAIVLLLTVLRLLHVAVRTTAVVAVSGVRCARVSDPLLQTFFVIHVFISHFRNLELLESNVDALLRHQQTDSVRITIVTMEPNEEEFAAVARCASPPPPRAPLTTALAERARVCVPCEALLNANARSHSCVMFECERSLTLVCDVLNANAHSHSRVMLCAPAMRARCVQRRLPHWGASCGGGAC